MKRSKRLIAILCLVVLLIVVACSLMRSTAFDNEIGSCISISLFGRFELQNIDKAVIAADGQEWAITDSDLIEQICNETRIANRVNLCYETNRRIDLYSGDKLVRSMHWAECCNTVKVYEPGVTHWLIGGLGQEIEHGSVELSDELMSRLNEEMEE